MNKSEKVRKHLKRYKSITTWKAIESYKETRLSAIIKNLRDKGWEIYSEWHYKKNIDDSKIKYVKYKLISIPNEE